MENSRDTAYSSEAVAAQDMFSRGNFSDNGAEITAWICLSADITKSYRDGYISDKDIDRRENFVNKYSSNCESFLTTKLGLLEKSNDPKAKEQMESLKRLLSVLRICRANVMQNTPPKNIAKRIQKRQEEHINKIHGNDRWQDSSTSPISNEDNSNSDSIFKMLMANQLNNVLSTAKSPFKQTGDKEFDLQNAMLAALLLASIDKKTLDTLLSGKMDKLDPKAPILADAFDLLQKEDFSKDVIQDMATLDVSDKNYALHVKEFFEKTGHTNVNFEILQHGVAKLGYAQFLKEALYNNSIIMPNAYDASIMNPLLNQKIENMSREDILAHQMHLQAQKTASTNSPTPSQNRPSFTVDNLMKKSIVSDR